MDVTKQVYELSRAARDAENSAKMDGEIEGRRTILRTLAIMLNHEVEKLLERTERE